ncbi:hypothetical protein P7C70_g8704, partial [Phenoliferia sp. Uapishka_3]
MEILSDQDRDGFSSFLDSFSRSDQGLEADIIGGSDLVFRPATRSTSGSGASTMTGPEWAINSGGLGAVAYSPHYSASASRPIPNPHPHPHPHPLTYSHFQPTAMASHSFPSSNYLPPLPSPRSFPPPSHSQPFPTSTIPPYNPNNPRLEKEKLDRMAQQTKDLEEWLKSRAGESANGNGNGTGRRQQEEGWRAGKEDMNGMEEDDTMERMREAEVRAGFTSGRGGMGRSTSLGGRNGRSQNGSTQNPPTMSPPIAQHSAPIPVAVPPLTTSQGQSLPPPIPTKRRNASTKQLTTINPTLTSTSTSSSSTPNPPSLNPAPRRTPSN